MEYCFMKLASAEIMIHPRHLPNSIIARKVWASEFSHSLGQPETFPALSRMSAVEGRPDVVRRCSELLILAKRRS